MEIIGNYLELFKKDGTKRKGLLFFAGMMFKFFTDEDKIKKI